MYVYVCVYVCCMYVFYCMYNIRGVHVVIDDRQLHYGAILNHDCIYMFVL